MGVRMSRTSEDLRTKKRNFLLCSQNFQKKMRSSWWKATFRWLCGRYVCTKGFISSLQWKMDVQRSDKVAAPGLANFVPTFAYHFLPAAFTQPGASTLADLCYTVQSEKSPVVATCNS